MAHGLTCGQQNSDDSSLAWNQAEPHVQCRIISRCGSGSCFLFLGRGFGFFPANAHELRDAGLLHCYAIKNAAGARRLEARERSEEHTSELQSRSDLVCRLLLEKK